MKLHLPSLRRSALLATAALLGARCGGAHARLPKAERLPGADRLSAPLPRMTALYVGEVRSRVRAAARFSHRR